MRQRIHDTHLPKGIYLKHGAYYKVVKGVWYRLSRDLPTALDLADEYVAPLDVSCSDVSYRKEILNYAYRVLGRARQNAKGRRSIAFDLTREDVEAMLKNAKWKCAVTNTKFSLDLVGRQRPLAPSIDRIDSTKGYHRENCRIVCVAANFAMNQWGEKILHVMAKNMMNTRQPNSYI